jgi:hypothetical protein
MFGRATNRQKGIVISPVNRWEDLGPGDPFPYRYVHGERDFEFRAMDYLEWRMWSSYNSTDLKTVPTATYIVGHFGGDQELKRNIKDGMLALVTGGGFRFRSVPNFVVEFLDNAREMPRLPPRPTNVDDVPGATISHEPLMLGGKKDIEFIYEDYGAQDTARGITITSIRKFEDIGFDDPVPYIFTQGDFIFEFRASQYREWRLASDGPLKGKLMRPHTATYVIEESIKKGINKTSVQPAEYAELKERIRDGMWVAETREERALREVPNFRLEFVKYVKDVPKYPSRPST